MHHWRSEGGYRRASCSEDSPRKGQEEDEFRERSKSLDGAVRRPQVSECEATYRIYNTILKEGTCTLLFLFMLLNAHDNVFAILKSVQLNLTVTYTGRSRQPYTSFF